MKTKKDCIYIQNTMDGLECSKKPEPYARCEGKCKYYITKEQLIKDHESRLD